MTEQNASTDATTERDNAKDAGKKTADAKAAGVAPKAAPQKPSVGRIVHFFDKRRWKETPAAAIITQVHADKTVNLFIWRPDGTTETKQGVAQQPAKEPSFENVWAWPERV